jgi:transposase
MISAISEDAGMEHYLLKLRSIAVPEFIEFLEDLHDKYFGEPLVLFMDNLNVHKTNEVKEVYQRLKITPVYNVPYSP